MSNGALLAWDVTADMKERIRRNGQNRVTVDLGESSKVKVKFVDAQPRGRQNMVFYADYSDKDAVMEAEDSAYCQIYHNDLPSALSARISWATKEPGSRSHCCAAKIEKVRSIESIIANMIQFLANSLDQKQLLGTILLFGHGNREEFSLPIVSGGKRLRLPMLECGLRFVDESGFSTRQPSEWKWGGDLWTSVRGDLQKLKNQTQRLRSHIYQRTDTQTLVRMWCCNLGREPGTDGIDALAILGGILLGGCPGSIEAPRYKSLSGHVHYTVSSDDGNSLLAKVFDDGRLYWHPDAVAEVGSDSNLDSLVGPDLQEAKAQFMRIALRPSPTPRGKNRSWIPFVAVEDERGREVYPFNWQDFTRLWRRVTLGQE